MTQKMQEKSQRSYQARGGTQYKGIIDLDKAQGLNLGKIAIAEHYWSIIPYLAGTHDPDPKVREGDPTYTVGVYVHRMPGTGGGKVICLARTLGQPCAFCQHREDLDRQPDGPNDTENKRKQDEIKSLLPSKNMLHLYYVWDRNKERDGLKIYEISAFFFEDELTTQAFDPRTKVMIPFMSPQASLLPDGKKNPAGGYDVFFKVTGDLTRQNWTGIKLVEREHPIPQWVLDQARVPLDELLNIPTPEEVHELFWAGQQEGAAPEPQDAAGPGYAPGAPSIDEEARQYCGDFRSGKCGSYADCNVPCQYYQECAQGGVVNAGLPEADIPFEPPAPPPQPEPIPTPAAPAPGVRPGGPPPPLRRQPR